MKGLKTILIIAGIIIFLVVIKFLFLQPSVQGSQKGPAGPPAPSVVTATIAKSQKPEKIVFTTGTIVANEEAELKPEISGKLVYINIQEGGYVSKGTLIAKINDADLQAQLKKINVQLKLAEEKDARQKQLLEIKGISQEEYDNSAVQVNSLKADQDNLVAQISKTEVRAPFNGLLGLKKISEGAYVSAGTSLVTIQQIDPAKIDFSVPEKYLSQVYKGTEVSVRPDGTDQPFKARVYAIDPKIDLATRSIQLRASTPNRSGKLLPGGFVRVELPLQQKNDVILIPTESIVPVLKGQKVYAVVNGKAIERMVETGVRSAAGIEVINGIAAGDTIVVTGVMALKNDAPVKIIKIQ
jgi:membrane fusion protein, multidrug efflux system